MRPRVMRSQAPWAADLIPNGTEQRRSGGITTVARQGRHYVALGATLLLAAACRNHDVVRVSSAASSGGTAVFASYDPGTAAGGPGAGRRYALGRPLSKTEIAAWNTDVGPDGSDLPPGRGTVAQGAALYAAKCAMCHSKAGEGMPPAYPALIGRDPKAEGFRFASDPKLVKTIGNYWPHATTVFDYVRRGMPYSAPGSLTNDEVYAVTAFLLAANKIIPAEATLDARSLRRVKMPYVDRFVPDDRHGGAEVR